MTITDKIYEIISDIIASKREGEYWDFKQVYHSNKADLIHDILCMANNRSGKDGYIIWGISDEPKGEVCGIERDGNRRNQQQIIDLLQSQKLKWAFGVYPSVELCTLYFGNHEVDVLIVKSTSDVPYYLTEDYSYTLEKEKPRVIRAYHIYTRVCDTNTPIDKSATPYQVEMLWRRRFGLDLPPLNQVQRKLLRRGDWESYEDDDTGDEVYYNKFSPEYTVRIRETERPEYPPFYSYAQYNESTGFYKAYVMYHSTILAKMEMVALDSGRYATPSPDISFIHSREDPTIAKYQYRYFLRNSIEYYVQQFLYDADNSEEVYAKQRFDNIVLYFDNEQQEEQFRIEIESRPEVLTLYIKKEEEPEVHSGNKELNQEYANRIKVSKALKAIQKDWNLHRDSNFE